ncbi:MAG: TonB-dependent receptor [Prevotella sp.]|nr:TonB-dependent receptor [Candidatus Prevotella equi]
MKRLLTIIVFAILALGVSAQDLQKRYADALAEYQNGHFSKCEELALGMVKEAKGMLKSSSYKLLALCRLEQGDIEGARQYTTTLLRYDPYYAPALGDPQRFIDLIEQDKMQGVTITTASQQAETLEESPVPVTVITEEMIKMSGAQTLRDLLCMFVPSMVRIDNIEANISMRGIYANTQEFVLIMIDGHRLNSGATNGEAPDFRNSLTKIKQIEVLRGPASSLYGNVALMGVVNIITKKGQEVNGGEVNARYGSYNSWGVDAIYGKGNLNGELLAWGSIYSSKGEKIEENGFTHYLEGYREKPAYDLGIKARWSDISMSISHQHAKPVPYYSQITLTPYSYDKYDSMDGSGPGSARTMTHANVDFNHSWDKWTLSASLYGSMERNSLYNGLGDRITPEMAAGLFDATPELAEYLSENIENIWTSIAWEDLSAGLNVNASTEYKIGSQHGSLLFGAQADIFSLTSSKLMQGYSFAENIPIEDETARKNVSTINDIIGLHTEHTISAYMQLKNYITKRLILNGGVRFDSKHRYDETYNTVSPRIALIWNPTQTSNIKLSYAHSFVDAPYLYRANQSALYSAGTHMKPQQNDAFQLTGSKTWKPIHLKTELNVYYNRLHDLCIFNYGGIKKNDMSGAFTTAAIDILGVEAVAEYNTEKTLVQLNMSYKYPVKIRDYGVHAHETLNDPRFVLDLVANQRIYKSEKVGCFNVHANMRFQTKAFMLHDNYLGTTANTEIVSPAQAIVNAGVNWEYWKVQLFLEAYNIFNSKFRYGTLLQSWLPAQSTKIMGKVAFKF